VINISVNMAPSFGSSDLSLRNSPTIPHIVPSWSGNIPLGQGLNETTIRNVFFLLGKKSIPAYDYSWGYWRQACNWIPGDSTGD
jgi:hypothetical protein